MVDLNCEESIIGMFIDMGSQKKKKNIIRKLLKPLFEFPPIPQRALSDAPISITLFPSHQ